MKLSGVFIPLLFGMVVSVPSIFAEETSSSESEDPQNTMLEKGTLEEEIDEDLPEFEEGEAGEIIERGIRRFRLKPRRRITVPKTSKPRIRIPRVRKPLEPTKPVRKKKRIKKSVIVKMPSRRKSELYIPNQVIVKLRPGMSLPLSLMKKFGLQKMRTTSGGHVLFRFAIPSGLEKHRNPLAVAKELAQHAAVLFAEPNFLGRPDAVPKDALFQHQWHYFQNGNGKKSEHISPGGIGLPKAWERKKGSQNVVVAVIDTGIVIKGKDGKVHPDIDQQKILPGFDFISDPKRAGDGDTTGRDNDPTDPGDGTDFGRCTPGVKGDEDTWHGTSMASVIGMGKTNNFRGTAGVNWEVSILPVRVSGKCGFEDIDLYDAIRWAAGLKTPDAGVNPNPARIINISMGGFGTCPKLIQEAIDEVVTKKGVSIVASAGNETTLAAFHHPSNCKGVISVAASDERGHLASYSNFGSAVTIMAPGGKKRPDQFKVPRGKRKPKIVPKTVFDQVLTHYHPDLRDPDIDEVPKGFSFGAGSSLSAPHVSGVLALWLAEDFSLTHQELLQGLKQRAFKRNKTQCPRGCGAGLLNADPGPLINPGKAVPPPPLKKRPPPKGPPPVSQCTITTSEIVHSLKIDIGNNDSKTTSAKQAMFRMMIHGDQQTRLEASSMIKATESGALAGIFQSSKGPVAARGQRMTPQRGWWTLLPSGERSTCLKEPAGESPMIIYRTQDMQPSVLEDALKKAWRQCGIPNLPFPCVYKKNMENKASCLDQAEEAFLKGEKQCDAKFGSQRGCLKAYQDCLASGNGINACSQRAPCVLSQPFKNHSACMKPFEDAREQAEGQCEDE